MTKTYRERDATIYKLRVEEKKTQCNAGWRGEYKR